MMVSRPSTFDTPESVAENSELVRRPAIKRGTLKVIGAGLSFSGAQLSSGKMISLDKLNSILKVPTIPEQEGGGALVKVEAGIRLRDLVT
jgi:L-gulono-1,4-lactone dehydrogenase